MDAGTTGTITNQASVSSDTADPNATNDTASEDTLVNAQADLSITKSDSPDPVLAGNQLTYTVTVDNAGPSDIEMMQYTGEVDVTPSPQS